MNNELKNIATINIADTKFSERNEGVIIVNSFDNAEIGLCISEKYNGDPQLWFDVDEALKIISSLEIAIKEIKDKNH
ncbi:hypothetical protein [Romboutsia lituseburensis]|uniref:Uncharacterized protein n=1 Tax=Romboutsia lituseburensis DSM 797 TaxID=1121325 RepID=A0A1G9PLH4_9FIRM|nr:hypothetical protein [Romboutsia lituseburensis]CEH33421.1 Hypothetical protein RLITU_0820 [Romboutsia lituseburensis]SDL99067.1 hypothetical protein SAMN04515677_104398 [Romboutsia lituseburensis DSM 797]